MAICVESIDADLAERSRSFHSGLKDDAGVIPYFSYRQIPWNPQYVILYFNT